MLRSVLLLSSALLSIGTAIAFGPMWMVACFALCLLSVVFSTEIAAPERRMASSRASKPKAAH